MASGEESEADDEARPSAFAMATILIMISVVVGLAGSELLLRLAWDNPYKNESTDYLIKLQMHSPWRNLSFDRRVIDPDLAPSVFRTNGRSYILPADQFENPDVTIAFLGGSTMQNSFVSEDMRFHGLVSRDLEKRGLRVNTLNAGYSAINTHDSINVLVNHVVFDSPDIAVMMHAHGDIGRLSRLGEYGPRRAGRASFKHTLRWISQWGSIHSSLIGALRQFNINRPTEIPPFTRRTSKALPQEKYTARLKAFIGIARAFGIEPVLMTQPVINMKNALTPDWHDPHGMEIFNHLIREVGREEGVVVIDIVKYLFEEIPNWNVPQTVFYDGVHINDFGSRVFADHMSDRLFEVITDLRRQRALRAAEGEGLREGEGERSG